MLTIQVQRDSLRRLYKDKKITEAQLQERIAIGKLDQEDYDYIIA